MADRIGIVRRDNFVKLTPFAIAANPFAQINMHSNAQIAVLLRILRGFGDCGMPHHEAGAGEYPAFMRFDDAAIHAPAQAEVIGIDD